MKPELIAVRQGLAEYRLTENHPLRIAHAAGRRIECLDGTAWITAYDQNTDFMLRRGQTFTVPNDGLILIDAVGGGVVRVRLPSGSEADCRISPTQLIVRRAILGICTMHQQFVQPTEEKII